MRVFEVDAGDGEDDARGVAREDVLFDLGAVGGGEVDDHLAWPGVAEVEKEEAVCVCCEL